jgi:hypothetical protein
MKKAILPLIICLMFSLPLLGQLSGFNLSEYKLADYKRHELDFRYGAENSLGDNSSFYGYHSRYIRLSQNLGGNYGFSKYTRNYSSWFYGGISSGYNFYKDEGDSTFRKYNTYSVSPYFSTHHTFYSDKEYFVQVSMSGQIRHWNSKSIRRQARNGIWSQNTTDISGNTSVYIRPSIGAGKGRVENVTDAMHAVHVLQYLKNSNRLTREPSGEEILALAKRITGLKNERVLDSRLHLIRELKELDSLLRSVDLLANSDMEYFTALNDMWKFGGLQPRYSGIRAGIYYKPDYTLEKYNFNTDFPDQTIDVENKNRVFDNKIEMGLEWAKPHGHKYQSSLNASIHTNFFTKKYNNDKETDKRLGSTIGYSLYYYPSTRTSIGFSNWLSANKSWATIQKEGLDEADRENWSVATSTTIDVNYYFSPQLRLNGFLYLNAYYKEKEFVDIYPRKGIYSTFSIGLLYSIF